MSLRSIFVPAAVIAAAGIASSASATTVATFADPTMGPNPSVFQWDSTINTLTASWSGVDLNLLTPGTAAPDYMDATFTMTPLVGVVNANIVTFGQGAVQFFDNLSNPIFRIEFMSATMLIPQGFGASEFVGNGVTFSGDALGVVQSISNETFAFSFANIAAGQGQSFEATAAFTSSADIIVPGPASLALLGVAGLLRSRRRR